MAFSGLACRQWLLLPTILAASCLGCQVAEEGSLASSDRSDLDEIEAIVTYYSYEGAIESHQVVYCLAELRTEVNNGGFNQYYFNSSGDYALETVAALETVGAAYTAEMVRRGNALFPEGRPAKDIDERREQLAHLSRADLQTLEQLNRPYYADPDDLDTLLRKYIAAHAEDFADRTKPWVQEETTR